MSVRLLIDAQDCPVKSEVYRLAQRYGVPVVLVTPGELGAPFEPWLTKVVVGAGHVAETIAGEATVRDLIVTDDAALAGRVLAIGAAALTSRGQTWTAQGPRPILPERKTGNNKARFETVLDDELRTRLKIKG